jgi:hypothetical protein
MRTIIYILAVLVLALPAKAIEVRERGAVMVRTGEPVAVPRELVRKREASGVRASGSKVPKTKTTEQHKLSMGRDNTRSASASAQFISVYDASVTYTMDTDGDGFHAAVDLDLDIDSSSGAHDVYVKLYYRVSGGDWVWFYTSSTFLVDGASSADTRRFAIQFEQGMPSDWYEWAVDVYEAGDAGVVASLEGSQDADLSSMPLEDRLRDNDSAGIYLDDLSLELLRDDDADGFYSAYTMDVGVYFSGAPTPLKAVLYSRGSDGQWYQEGASSAVLALDGDHLSFTFDADLPDAWDTDYYDFAVDVVDADTGALLWTMGPESSVLAAVPLEGAGWDAPVTSTVVVVESSGGSMGTASFLLLAFLVLIRPLRRSGRSS